MIELRSWLQDIIKKSKGRNNVIPISNELLGFCNGDYPTAALLTQLLYWKDKTTIKGGWIAKSAKDWYKELYLSERQVTRVGKSLIERNLIESKIKKFNGSPIKHYRLRETILKKDFIKYLKTGCSISTKGENPIVQNVKLDFDEMSKSTSTKCENSIGQNSEMDFDERCKSITETTTETNSEIKSENKTESVFDLSEKSDFEILRNEMIKFPKEKSCGKKEKVIIQLPFESEIFEQVWNGWKAYLLQKSGREYSVFEEQAALMPLQNYDEVFVQELITKAISSGWKSFHFEDTAMKYQNYLIKKTKSNEKNTSNELSGRLTEVSENCWSEFD